MLKRTISLIGLILIGLVTAVSAQEPNRAALVIRLEDGQTISHCVEFTEAEINGYELLNRSGLELETEVVGMGATVCSIEGQGCPANDCFCQCKGGGDCLYWSYWQLKEGAWQYAQAGASTYRVYDGDIQGWSWGIGTPDEAVEPPLLTFDEVCTENPENDTQTTNETAAQTIPWLGYAIFGIVILGLGGFLALKRPRD
jgi:hypothetical protein